MRVILLAVLAGTAASAQTYVVHQLPSGPAKGYDEVHLSKAALAGQQVRVWWAMMLDPDCSPHGTMTTQVLEPPRHGRVTLSDDPFFPSFVEPNPRAACDTKKVPGKQAFYTAEPGFHGRDKLVLQNATSEGRMRRIVVDLTVQ